MVNDFDWQFIRKMENKGVIRYNRPCEIDNCLCSGAVWSEYLFGHYGEIIGNCQYCGKPITNDLQGFNANIATASYSATCFGLFHKTCANLAEVTYNSPIAQAHYNLIGNSKRII